MKIFYIKHKNDNNEYMLFYCKYTLRLNIRKYFYKQEIKVVNINIIKIESIDNREEIS